MAALPVVPKVVRVDHHMSAEADSNMMIHNFLQYSGILSLADATTWLGICVTAFNTFVAAVLSTRVTTVLHEMTDLSSNSAPQVQSSVGAVGTDGNALGSAGTAMVMKYHIVRRYRGGHPRVYIPGITAGHVLSTGLWDSAFLGTVVGDYITYINACRGGTVPAAIGSVTHVNISYFLGFTNHTYPSGRVKPIPTPRATPLIDTITNITGNPFPGSQRRRNEQP